MDTNPQHKPFAEMDLPEVIYKYRTWSDEYHKKVITNRQVFLAPPSSFEDSFDCKNNVRYDLLSKEEKLEWIIYQLKDEFPGQESNFYVVRAKELYNDAPISDNNKIQELQHEQFLVYDQRIGILSLTANSMNAEMWKKYSDDFKGVCIGFNPIVMFEFLGGGGIVQYVDELPIIYPEPKYNYLHQSYLQIYYKEKKWSFEEEYRTHTFQPYPLSMENRTITLPPQAYKKILLGPKMSDEDKENLKKAIPPELNHVEVMELKDEDF